MFLGLVVSFPWLFVVSYRMASFFRLYARMMTTKTWLQFGSLEFSSLLIFFPVSLPCCITNRSRSALRLQ
jgi:hypothetical protein